MLEYLENVKDWTCQKINQHWLFDVFAAHHSHRVLDMLNSLRAADLYIDSLRRCSQRDRHIYRCAGTLTTLFVLVAVATRWHSLDLATPLTFEWAHSLRMYKIKGGAGVRSSCPTFRAYNTRLRAMNADLPWKRGLPAALR